MSTIPQDAFLITCRRCECDILAPREWIGREVGCPFCSSVLRVPAPVEGVRAVPAASPSLAPQRYFNFACPRCDVLIEAHTGMSGQPGHCPTCGTGLTIPHIDPSTGLPAPVAETDPPPTADAEPENPTPLHAYAADGRLAPQIVRLDDGTAIIRCSGCGADNPLDADCCAGCGLPFTLDAAPTGRGSRLRAAGIAAVTLGVLGLASVYLPFLLLPAGLALALGLRACSGRSGPSLMGMLGAGLGFVGLCGGAIGLSVL